jgi:hypothetical protein
VLIGLTTLGVLLQGLRAGLSLRERGGHAPRWVAVRVPLAPALVALAVRLPVRVRRG